MSKINKENTSIPVEKCLFCTLSKNKANIIYENESIYVIMDRFPVSDRHFLIIPKIHSSLLHENDDASLTEMILTAKKLALLFKMKKYNLLQNNINEQIINHTHLHLIECNETGRFKSAMNSKIELNDTEYSEECKKLKDIIKDGMQ